MKMMDNPEAVLAAMEKLGVENLYPASNRGLKQGEEAYAILPGSENPFPLFIPEDLLPGQIHRAIPDDAVAVVVFEKELDDAIVIEHRPPYPEQPWGMEDLTADA